MLKIAVYSCHSLMEICIFKVDECPPLSAQRHNEDNSTSVASTCGKGGVKCASNGFNWSTSDNCKGQTVNDLYISNCLDVSLLIYILQNTKNTEFWTMVLCNDNKLEI